ncbi:MlaD family protein [Candidatus Thiodictyon syntrophicum]|jgi:phospholipid/cholesterol/gamma-HCH transport system substrate-binding protein|uniref:Mammalian cell entry protein n=1 Tax=Candidatus Thiodictyon syntrophicum TaxID=1166950 RepID=A0A2K8U528_9GAMM|nr:mammalian cell entry protein [Candidatus Thiodictyon syntrophicum]AUB80672.1 mammalian cell entry protein [Candidatus Thiodictyon syntrophicum]
MSRLERLYSPPEIGAPGKREARQRHRDLFYSGLFVLAMAAVAIAALALLMPGLFGGSYRLHAYFLDAAGLGDGIQVIQEGQVIGLVEGVTPLFPGRDARLGRCPAPAADAAPRSPALPCFRATLRIKRDWPVPTDSLAQLGSPGLLQGEAILIRPSDRPTTLRDGDEIMTRAREPDLMAKLNELTRSLDGVVKETIAPALASIKAQIETIETLLGTGGDQAGNRDRLAGAFESLQKLSANIESSIDPKKVAAILDSVQTLSKNLTEVSAKLGGGTEEIKGTARQYGDLARDLRGLVSDNKPALQRSLEDTQGLLQDLNASLTPILVNIEDASRNLAAFSRDLRRDPAVIIKGRKVEEQAPWFK